MPQMRDYKPKHRNTHFKRIIEDSAVESDNCLYCFYDNEVEQPQTSKKDSLMQSQINFADF